MSRPRKRKPRSGEQDASGEQDTLAEGVEVQDTLAERAEAGVGSELDVPLRSSDDDDVVRAVGEVADAIVARVLAGEGDDADAEPDGDAASVEGDAEDGLEVQTLDLDALEAAGIGASPVSYGGDSSLEDDGSLPGEDTEERPGLEKAPPLAVSDEHLKSVIESLLFVADKPLPTHKLSKIARSTTKDVQRLLDVLAEDYRGRGVELIEVAGGYQFRSAAANAPFVRELVARKPVRLTRAQVEALAMIAYRQPITRPEVDEIRGVDSGSAMKVLLEKNLVKIIGRKDEAGRPLLYGTTPFFLEFFGLASLSDLPTLREYSDLNDESRALFQRRTGEAIEDIADIQVEKHDYSDEDLEAAAQVGSAEDADGDTQLPLPSPSDDDDDDAPARSRAEDDDDAEPEAPARPDTEPVEGDDDDDDSDDDDDDDDDDESDDDDEDEDEDDEDDDDEDEDDDD